MNTTRKIIQSALLGALALAGSNLRAQYSWTGAGGDGLWNTTANWDYGIPSEFISGIISNNFEVTYDSPMAASNFGGLTLSGNLTINAAGFNIDTFGADALVGNPEGADSSLLTINSGGEVTISNSGAVTLNTGFAISVDGGSFLMISNSAPVAMGNNGNNAGIGFTNNGGTVVFDQPVSIRGRYSRFIMNDGTLDCQGGLAVQESSNDQERPVLFNGGVANLGDFAVSRTSSGGGLLVSNGVVNATSIRIGTTAAAAYGTVYGGVISNSGPFLISDRNNGATSKDRRIQFRVRGGSVISTSPEGMVVNAQGNNDAASANVIGSTLEVSGGSLTAEGIRLLMDDTLTNAWATLDLSGDGVINLGSGGLTSYQGAGNSASYINLHGGKIVAMADLAINGDPNFVEGNTVLQAADDEDVPHDITIAGGIMGSGDLTKTGGGQLIIQGVATHTGTIYVNEGSLSIGVSGSLPDSSTINVADGAVIDVGFGFILNTSKALAGSGIFSNAVYASTGSFLQPGGNGEVGALTFTDDLTLGGGVINNIDASAPASSDSIMVGGLLTLTGENTILVNALNSLNAGVYPVFHYGTLAGDLSNLSVVGITATLTNDTANNMIAMIVAPAVRPSTNLVWKGDNLLNNWDYVTPNWLAGGATDYFLGQDDVTFDDSGSASPAVNLADVLTPASVTVDATQDYTLSGDGRISGGTGLLKMNTGKLTVQATNDYTGVTEIQGGTLGVETLEDANIPSPIGAADDNPANLVLSNDGVLEYAGSGVTFDRPLTLGGDKGGISVATDGVTLTAAGEITGAGTLVKQGPGQLNLTGANDYSGGTEVTEGVLRPTDGSLGTGPLTLNGNLNGATLRFDSDQQTLNNTLNIVGVNNNLLNNGNNTLSDITGDGTVNLNVSSGTTLTLSGDMSTFSGTLMVGDLSNLRFYPSTGSSNALIDLGLGTCYLNNRNGNLTVQVGGLTGGPTTQVLGASSVSRPTTYVIGGKNLDTTFDGTIEDNRSGAAVVNLVKVGTGKLAITGINTYSGSTVVSNGVLSLGLVGTIDNSTTVSVVSPGILDLSEHADGTLYVGQTAPQTLEGDGTIRGNVIVDILGTNSPGYPVGTLTVTNTITMNSGSTTLMELNRNAAQNSDRIKAASITVGGYLVVTNVGATLEANDTFKLFDGPISGVFDAVALPAYYTWDTSNLTVDGTIKVTGAPNAPQFTTVGNLGGNLMLTGNAGASFAYSAYYILTSPDVTAPLSTWTPVVTNYIEADGSFAYTNALPTTAGEQFYLMVLP